MGRLPDLADVSLLLVPGSLLDPASSWCRPRPTVAIEIKVQGGLGRNTGDLHGHSALPAQPFMQSSLTQSTIKSHRSPLGTTCCPGDTCVRA